MCGILGIYNLDGSSVIKDSIVEMGNQINHRGPDGEGFLFKTTLVLYTSVSQF